MTAPATTLPPLEWFTDPQLDELTPLTVNNEGRIFGHLCGWQAAHRGLNGNVRPPRSQTGYREFLLHACRVQDGDDVRTVAVGNITMSTGHAAMNADLRRAVDHYDNSGSVVAQVAVGEDQFGVWYSGAVLPDVDDLRLRRLMTCGLSGDWRALDRGSNLELCAALAVPVPGFSAPRARVASGSPLALVAAGFVPPVQSFGRKVDPSWSKSEPIQSLAVGKLTGMSNPSHPYATISAAGEWAFYPPATTSATTISAPTPATLAAQIDRAIEARERKATLAAQRESLLAEVDDTAARHAALVASLDDTADRKAKLLAELGDAGEGFDVSGMPPQLKEEWLHGEIAARIAYGTPGQFDRCRAIAREKQIPKHQIDGLCANLIREKTGRPPGDHGDD